MALFNESMFVEWYDNSIAVTGEQHKVVDGRCILNFIPDEFFKVQAWSGATQLFEIKKNQTLTSSSQFLVDYSNGYVTFYQDSYDNTFITFAFHKRGVLLQNANRIVTDQNPDRSIKETLDQLIDEVRTENQTANSAEEIRLDNEVERKQSETQREIDEDIRKTNNTTFVTNNTNYTNAENSRASQEVTRQSQETARQTAINSFRHVGEWTSNLVLSKNNITTFNGSSYLYIANTTSTTAQPTDNGITYELIATGGSNIRYRNTHQVGVSYIPLDVVNYNNYQYINILATSSQLPTNATYWEVYNYTKIGELKNTITLSVAANQFNILIPEYNKNNDIIEIIQNSTRIWEGIDFSISDFTQGLISKIGEGNFNSGTVFYIRVLKNMRMTITLQDGALIEAGTIGLSSLSPSVQSAILANTQMVRSYPGNLTIPFESATNDIDISATVSAYDYSVDCLLIYINGRMMTLGSEYTKSYNRILKVDGNWGGNNAGESDVFDIIVLKSVSNTPLGTYSGSLITDASVTNAKLSSLILQNLANMNSTTGLVVQNTSNGFTKRSIVSSDTKLTVTNGNGVSGNPTLTLNEDNLNFTNGLTQQQISTPSTPASGYSKLYPKSDGKFYKKNSNGYESCIEYGISTKEIGLTGDGTTNDATKLNAWITSIGSTKVDLIVTSGTYLISTNVTFPANVRIVGMFGGMFKVSNGISLNGNGTLLECGLWQVFDLSLGGSVGGNWGIGEYIVEWFGIIGGDVNTNNSPILEKLINSIKTIGGVISFSRKTYNFYTKVTANGRINDVMLKGISSQDPNGTIFTYNGTGYLFNILGGDYIEFQDIHSFGDNTNGFITFDDNSPTTANCRIGTSRLTRLNLKNFLTSINIDCPVGYLYLEGLRINYIYEKGIAIGENYSNTYSVSPGYIYLNNCNIEGMHSGTTVNGIEIYVGQWIFINKCDICNFQNYGIYMNSLKGDIDHISITDNSLYNNATATYIYRDNYMANIKYKGNMCRIREAGNGYVVASKTETNYVHGMVVDGEMFSLAGNEIGKIIDFEYIHNLSFINNVPPYVNSATVNTPTKNYATFNSISGLFNKATLFQKQSTQNTSPAGGSVDVTVSGFWSWIAVPTFPTVINLRPELGAITWTSAYSTTTGVWTITVNNAGGTPIPFQVMVIS